MIVLEVLTIRARVNQHQFWGGLIMLRTITLGSCVSVQGTFVHAIPDGRIAVKVNNTVYSGTPITKN